MSRFISTESLIFQGAKISKFLRKKKKIICNCVSRFQCEGSALLYKLVVDVVRIKIRRSYRCTIAPRTLEHTNELNTYIIFSPSRFLSIWTYAKQPRRYYIPSLFCSRTWRVLVYPYFCFDMLMGIRMVICVYESQLYGNVIFLNAAFEGFFGGKNFFLHSFHSPHLSSNNVALWWLNYMKKTFYATVVSIFFFKLRARKPQKHSPISSKVPSLIGRTAYKINGFNRQLSQSFFEKCLEVWKQKTNFTWFFQR